MRDITKVIDSIVVEVDAGNMEPEDKSYLVKRLKSIRTTACYTAPECQIDLWYLLAERLQADLPNPTKPDAPLWVRRVSAIMMDTPIPTV